MKIFGFEITKKLESKTEKENVNIKTFASPMETDGTTIVSASSMSAGAGYYGQVLDIEGSSLTNEKDLILRYRAAAAQPECDNAISDIVNAAIVSDSDGFPVNLILDSVNLTDAIKKKINTEFNSILKLLQFNLKGDDLFRRWYVDGKLYCHLVVDSSNLKAGIKEIIHIDPLKIKKIKEVTNTIDKVNGTKTSKVTDEYFLYSDNFTNSTSGLKIDVNSVVYVPSGLTDETGKVSISHLNKSVKVVNQLRMMEDSLVIYRISRAPERRIFYIDVGNLPKGKSEEYVQGIMAKYRNKLVYDANTGEIRDDRKSMSMLEDFWLPRREGGKGTEITTLPGGENLSQIEDVLFFQKKLYRSLNVPAARLESDTGFNLGRVSEISREEVKFQKFINRLRKKFSSLFIQALKVQLILKSVITLDDWENIVENIAVDYVEDNFFSELKDFEIMKERISMLDAISPHIGKYYSEKWVRSNVLNQSDHDIEQMTNDIFDEKSKEDASAGEEEDNSSEEEFE